MLRRPRRPALLLPLALALLTGLAGLTACGEETPAGTAEGFDAVEVSGEVGATPTVEWKAELRADEPETQTLVEGEGPELAAGDRVVVNYYVGNGFTQEPSLDTFGEESPGTLVTVGEPPAQPQTEEDVVAAYAASTIEEGMTVGSRLAVVAGTEQALQAPGLASLDIGNEDPLLFVIDLVSQPLDAPEGEAAKAPKWAPTLVEKKGVPTGLGFADAPKPDERNRAATLIEGTGEPVESGDVLVANYLGQVYDGEQPFDESYSRGAPVGFPIDLGMVVKGWDRSLVGVPAGSRVVLQVPPKFGYGEQGQPDAGIKGTDTLYFVIDVLASA